MRLFTLEHSQTAYRADFGTFGVATLGLAMFLVIEGPADRRASMTALALAGLVGWTLIEYAIHRFVLHGVRPFSDWHAEHHRRPTALIYTPTLLSVLYIVVLAFLPALVLGGLWPACALTFGVLAGNFSYAISHHAAHHWRAGNAWSLQRKRWHALHHADARGVAGASCNFGVTLPLWDHVFGTHRG